eukprot:4448659-Amphidinium_carterae.2
MAESRVEDRNALLGCLLRWLLATPSWSQLGQQLQDNPQDVALLSIVADAFADRATGALRMRVNSLKQFERWRWHVALFRDRSLRRARWVRAPRAHHPHSINSPSGNTWPH